jgi:putative peptidoglycan lipid II flippase
MNEQGYPLGYGAPSYLYYAQRMYQLPLGVFGISLATAIFPVMSSDAAKKDYSALSSTVSRGLQAALFVAVPAMAGLILVARPAISVIFEHGRFSPADTTATAWTLSFYTLGLAGFFAQQIVIRAFYSLQNSKLPALTAVIAVGANVCLNLSLIWPLGPGGLALATSLCSYLQVFILLLVLRRKYGLAFLDGFGRSVGKTFLGTVLMVAIGLAILTGTKAFLSDGHRLHEMIRLVLVILGGGGIYLIMAWIMKNPMLSLILSRRKRTQTPSNSIAAQSAS